MAPPVHEAVEGLDRITRLEIGGMRAIADLTLDSLDARGLTVLLGENGSGKSSVIEALAILKKFAEVKGAVGVLNLTHGGLDTLLHQGATELFFAVEVAGAGPRLRYEIAFARVGTETKVRWEILNRFDVEGETPFLVIGRDIEDFYRFDPSTKGMVPVTGVSGGELLALPASAFSTPEVRRLGDALSRILVRTTYEVSPLWMLNEQNRFEGPRVPDPIAPTQTLNRLGGNLASAVHELKNGSDASAERFIERCRLGLGGDFSDLKTRATGVGRIELYAYFQCLPDPVPARALSEGQLAFILLVAETMLAERCSIAAFDEPERHFHPSLVARAAGLLEALGRSCPVIVATHADAFLDALTTPAESALLLDLDEHRATRARRVDAVELATWLADYRGLGDLRTQGMLPYVIASVDEADEVGTSPVVDGEP
jgi:predicted ATPase